MATVTISVKGLKGMIAKLNAKKDDYEKKAKQALMQAGFFLEGEVKQSIAGHRAEHMSVDTGRFLQSVITRAKDESSVIVETNVEYAPFLEYGTSKSPPRSHFRNSAARNKNKVKEIFMEKLKS